MEQRFNKKIPLMQIHAAVLLFGMAGLFGKWLNMVPVVIVFGRTFFATLFLWWFLQHSKKSFRLEKRSDYWGMALLGAVLAIHWITFFHSVQISTVAVGLISYSTFPVFVTFLEPFFFREKLHIKNIFTALVAFGGIILVVPEFRFENQITAGVLWGVISGLTFAILSVLNRNYVKRYSAILIAFYQDGIAAVLLLPFLFLFDFRFEPSQLILLILLGVVFTALAHSLMIQSMKRLKVQTISIISTLEPVYGVLLAIFLLSEIPQVRTIIGGSIILAVAFYVTVYDRSHN